MSAISPRIFCAALEARQAKHVPMLDRFIGSFSRSAPRKRGSAISSSTTTASTCVDEEVFERDPVNLIALFWLADRHGSRDPPRCQPKLATRSLKLMTPTLRRDERGQPLFLEILTSKNKPERQLRRMNEAGVLGASSPISTIVAMMQFNMYHHYTVDEHLIRSIGVLSEIEAGGRRAAPARPS
jgi:[protein-PII] uridylyltransferase